MKQVLSGFVLLLLLFSGCKAKKMAAEATTLDPRSVVLSDGEEEIEVFEKEEDLKFDSTGVRIEKSKEYAIIGYGEPLEFSGDLKIADPRETAMTGSQGNVKQKDQPELMFSRKGENADAEINKGQQKKKKKNKKEKKNKNTIPVEGQEREVVSASSKAIPFTIGAIDKVDKVDLMFSIKEIALNDKNVEIKVQYGGGCVRPHVFELVTDGVIDATGKMDFFLLHKTHDDKCKALILETLIFDFQPLYNLNSQKLTSFKINEMRKMDL